MMIKNTPDAYGLITKIIHWTTALLIFGLLFVGFYMADLPYNEDKIRIYMLHKSFGLVVLLLVFGRVAWHILSRKPKSLDTHAPWEKFLAHGAHMLLYVVMFAMPLSGWVMSSAGDFTVNFFGIQMPDIVAKNETLFNNAKEVHEIIAIIIIGVVGLHMAGAFKHHFIDRDRTIKRMTRENLGFVGGAVLVVTAGLLMLPPVLFVANDIFSEDEIKSVTEVSEVAVSERPPISKDAWTIDRSKSKIKFDATQYGQSFEGIFEEFEGVIVFNSENLMAARANIMINIGSIKIGADDRDGQAVGADWFDFPNYPTAHFVAGSFESVGENKYLARGFLTIRGVTLPIELPFDLKIDQKEGEVQHAEMKAEISLNRLDFGIGQGEWKSTDAIGNEVKMKIEIDATK